MKKTTLFLLSSVCFVAGCYTTPEMNENKYRKQYEESPMSCASSGVSYQHEGLRKCMEARMAFDDANKKTVRIKEQKNGSALVVPRAFDDENMMEDNRVYEIVGLSSGEVVIEEGVSPEVITTTVTIEKVKKVDEKAKGKVAPAASKGKKVDKAEKKNEKDSKPSGELSGFRTIDTPAEDVSDAKKTENKSLNTAAEHSEDKTTNQKNDTVENENAVQGITLVVGPVKEELVISVKSADATKKETTKAADAKKVAAVKTVDVKKSTVVKTTDVKKTATANTVAAKKVSSIDTVSARSQKEIAQKEDGSEGGSVIMEGFKGGPTVSQIDFITTTIRKYWNFDAKIDGIENMSVVLEVTLNPDGHVALMKIKDDIRMNQNASFRSVADSAKRAVYRCDKLGDESPFRLLAQKYPSSYREWKRILLKFNPVAAKKTTAVKTTDAKKAATANTVGAKKVASIKTVDAKKAKEVDKKLQETKKNEKEVLPLEEK